MKSKSKSRSKSRSVTTLPGQGQPNVPGVPAPSLPPAGGPNTPPYDPHAPAPTGGPSTGHTLPGYETIFIEIVLSMLRAGQSVQSTEAAIPVISQLVNSMLKHFGTRQAAALKIT